MPLSPLRDLFNSLYTQSQKLADTLSSLPEPSDEELQDAEEQKIYLALAEIFAQKVRLSSEPLSLAADLCLLAWLPLQRTLPPKHRDDLQAWAESRCPSFAQYSQRISQIRSLLQEKVLLVRCSYALPSASSLQREILIFFLHDGKPSKLSLSLPGDPSSLPSQLHHELSQSPEKPILFTLYKKD